MHPPPYGSRRRLDRPRGLPLGVCALLLLLPALSGCVSEEPEPDEAEAEAARQARYAALVIELETERHDSWQELNQTLRAYFAGDATRAEALAVLREAQQTYESNVGQLNATEAPPALENAHEHLLASYRLGLQSLEAAEACVAGTDLFACARAPELGRASMAEHRQFVDAFPPLPEELRREFPLPTP